jgi:heptaprenyl diphosphate synthase
MMSGKKMSTLLSGRKNIALLGAFCLFLSAVEYMIPKPLPFMRIGLANLPLMLALDLLPFPSFMVLVSIKVFGQALITGTLFSYIFLFSLTGTFLSALLMFFLRRIFGKKHITFAGIGTAGAVISGISQLALAWFFIFRGNVRYIMPPFLAASLVTGIILGMFCETFSHRSKWFMREKEREERKEKKEEEREGEVLNNREKIIGKGGRFYWEMFSANGLFITGVLIMPALLFNPGTELRVIQFIFLWLLVLLSGKKVNHILTIIVITGIVAFNLIIPYGYILFSIGPFKITTGALKAGIHRAVTLQGLIMLSKLTIREDLRIPGVFGELTGESLRIFSAMMARKNRITGKDIFAGIDRFITEISGEDIPTPASRQRTTSVKKKSRAGYIILAAVVFLTWLPWFF